MATSQPQIPYNQLNSTLSSKTIKEIMENDKNKFDKSLDVEFDKIQFIQDLREEQSAILLSKIATLKIKNPNLVVEKQPKVLSAFE